VSLSAGYSVTIDPPTADTDPRLARSGFGCIDTAVGNTRPAQIARTADENFGGVTIADWSHPRTAKSLRKTISTWFPLIVTPLPAAPRCAFAWHTRAIFGDRALQGLGNSSEWRGRFHRDPIFLSGRPCRRNADRDRTQGDNDETVHPSLHAVSFLCACG
jgi:hypothetical protein